MAEQEWLDAGEALRILGIKEGELQMLVASGALRAYRSAGTMKFRREDLATVKLQSDMPIIIPPTVTRPGESGILVPLERITPELIEKLEESPSGVITRVSESVVHTGLPLENPARKSSVSRIRTPGSRVGMNPASSRRTAPVFRYKPANPLMTAVLLLNAIVLTFSGSLGFIMLNVGYYDPAQEQRIIPPYLNHESSTPVYRWCYHNTPGNPQDKKPLGEYDGR